MSLFKSNIRDSLSLTDYDNQFQTFAKLGIWQGINFLFKRDIFKILSGYREIILVDFSNIIRNIEFLGSMQYLGYNVAQFIDLSKQIIPYKNFQYILPMLIDLLKLFSHNRIFLIYIPGNIAYSTDHKHVILIETYCNKEGVPCPKKYKKNEVDDHSLLITYLLLEYFSTKKHKIGILSGDKYRWSISLKDPNLHSYYTILQSTFQPKVFEDIINILIGTNETRYQRLVADLIENVYYLENNIPFSINTIFLIKTSTDYNMNNSDVNDIDVSDNDFSDYDMSDIDR